MFTWYIQTAQTVKMDKANRTYGIPLRSTLTWVITSAMPCAKVHERVLFVARVAIAGKQRPRRRVCIVRYPSTLYCLVCRGGHTCGKESSCFEYARLESKKLNIQRRAAGVSRLKKQICFYILRHIFLASYSTRLVSFSSFGKGSHIRCSDFTLLSEKLVEKYISFVSL